MQNAALSYAVNLQPGALLLPVAVIFHGKGTQSEANLRRAAEADGIPDARQACPGLHLPFLRGADRVRQRQQLLPRPHPFLQ